MMVLKKEEDALLFIVGRVQRKKRARQVERGKGNCYQSFTAWESRLISKNESKIHGFNGVFLLLGQSRPTASKA